LFPAHTVFELFWWYLVFHAIFDYGLQSEFIAKGKNHREPLPNVPWVPVLMAHSIMHGGAVAFVSGNVYLGAAEFVAHFATDFAKSAGFFGADRFRAHIVDQIVHILWKILWIAASFFL